MSKTFVFNHVFKDSDDFFVNVTRSCIDELGIHIDCVTDVDWDSDIARNIFFSDCNDMEYSIRLWTIHETDDKIYVEVSVYFTLPDGSGHEVL